MGGVPVQWASSNIRPSADCASVSKNTNRDSDARRRQRDEGDESQDEDSDMFFNNDNVVADCFYTPQAQDTLIIEKLIANSDAYL